MDDEQKANIVDISGYDTRKKIREKQRDEKIKSASAPILRRNQVAFDADIAEFMGNEALAQKNRGVAAFNKNVQLEDINANQGRNNAIEPKTLSNTEYRAARRDILVARAKLMAGYEVSMAKKYNDTIRPLNALETKIEKDTDYANSFDMQKTFHANDLPALSDFGIERLKERTEKLARMLVKTLNSELQTKERVKDSSDRLYYQDLYRAVYNHILDVGEGPDIDVGAGNLRVGEVVFFKEFTLVDTRAREKYGDYLRELPYRYGLVLEVEDSQAPIFEGNRALITPVQFNKLNKLKPVLPGYAEYVGYNKILPIPRFDQVQTKFQVVNKDFDTKLAPYEQVIESVPDLDELGRKIIIPKTSRQMIAEDELAEKYFLSAVAARKDEVVGVDKDGNPILKDKAFPVDLNIYRRVGEYLGLPDPDIVGVVQDRLQRDANYTKALNEFRALPRPPEEIKVKGIKRVRDANYKEVPIDDPDFITEDEADDEEDSGDAKRQKTDE